MTCRRPLGFSRRLWLVCQFPVGRVFTWLQCARASPSSIAAPMDGAWLFHLATANTPMCSWARAYDVGLGGIWSVEQPSRSLMMALPTWQYALDFFAKSGLPVKVNTFCMASFRAPTLKPTALYSTEEMSDLMNLPLPPPVKRPKTDAPAWKVCLGRVGQNVFQSLQVLGFVWRQEGGGQSGAQADGALHTRVWAWLSSVVGGECADHLRDRSVCHF